MLRTNKVTYLSFPLIFSILISCHVAEVGYSTKKIPAVSDKVLSHVVLDIELFQDSRKEHEKNNVLFKPQRHQTEAEKAWYWNVDPRYKKNVPEAMTEQLATHVRQRGSFKAVVVNKKNTQLTTM